MGLGACLALCSREAAADEPHWQLDFVYEAPPSCPSRAELADQVRARVPTSWLTRPDERRFEVHIVREEDGRYIGRLDVRGATTHEVDVREIKAATCKAVSTSLAVFFALALDSSGDIEEDHEAPRPTPSVSEEGSVRPDVTRRSPPPSSPAVSSWVWSSGFHVVHLRAPAAAWGGRVHAELARAHPDLRVAPAVRLSWGWVDFSVPAARAGEARFRINSARIEGCARIPLPSSFAVSPCMALDSGVLSGLTPELRASRRIDTAWVAGGAGVRGSWSLVDWLVVEIDTSLLVPITRTNFELAEPFRDVYRIPNVLVEATVGACLSARFH